MTHAERTALYRRVITRLGAEGQILKSIEELSECAAALVRVTLGVAEPTDYSVISEIADAEIMLEQLRIIFGDEGIDHAKRQKLYRLKERIEKEEK